jgi:hypothetical protein
MRNSRRTPVLALGSKLLTLHTKGQVSASHDLSRFALLCTLRLLDLLCAYIPWMLLRLRAVVHTGLQLHKRLSSVCLTPQVRMVLPIKCQHQSSF